VVTLTTPRSGQDSGTSNGLAPTGGGRRPALLVVGFLVGFLPLNTYWALGGTWGLGWVLGCADCTVALSLVWVQEALIGAGIAVLLAASGIWRTRLPGRLWRVGTWTMAAAFAAVGAQNLIGDNTPQARLLFAPLTLTLGALCATAAHRFTWTEKRNAFVETRLATPPPRWARRAAVLAVLTTVPCGLWRMAMAVGIPVGASDEILRERYGFPGWGTVYVFGLSFLLVGLALLTLGLVQGWGEVVPLWIPLVGGKPVPPMAAVVPAGTGAAALTVLWAGTFSNVGEIWALYGLDGAERVFMMACYLPLLLWGPLLAAVTVSYHRRHRRARVSLAAEGAASPCCAAPPSLPERPDDVVSAGRARRG